MVAAGAPEFDDLAALDDQERGAVRAQLLRLADDELVAAERYTDWQVRAPTLESDIALANIAQDELGHARLWYEVAQQFGDDEADLIWERDPSAFRHCTLVELPFREGDWADAVVRSYLYDVAEDIRLHALAESSIGPVRDRIGKVLDEEDYHLEHAHSWLERLADHERGRVRVQAAVDRLFPYALTIFEPVGDVEDAIDDLGIRTDPLDAMRAEWSTRIEETLEGLGLDVPAHEPAEPVGRDQSHTDHWTKLHDEMTETYRELGRDSAASIIDNE